jgi:hypothetical protein
MVARTSYESEDYRNLDAEITIVLNWHGLCKFHSYQRLKFFTPFALFIIDDAELGL